ncbi:hypothetical protein AQJ46_07420 [Streptomyces canus]|uniref:Uncharacterized protein n=1 Tax=Streptomyces canus TaxID=58343 RepID=A0A117R6C5_9ACTN|nr:hypothetical protein AQJ46_07420 [Streptomyces canus]
MLGFPVRELLERAGVTVHEDAPIPGADAEDVVALAAPVAYGTPKASLTSGCQCSLLPRYRVIGSQSLASSSNSWRSRFGLYTCGKRATISL